MKQVITSRSARWLAALGLGLTQFGISGPGQPQPAQAVVGKVCLPFTTLAPLQPSYVVGNSFTENAQLITAGPFTWSDSTVFAGGNAKQVINNMALGSPTTEMQVNNITLGTVFGTPMTQVSFKFGEFGGNINLRINGNLANVDNFDDVNAAVIGGVLVQVFGDGDGQGAGEVVLSGVINSVGVGGQELWIDDLCFSDVPDDGTPNDPVPPVQAKADLGDAPDSTNHYALNNTAYTFPGVVFGQYPTVFTSGIASDAPGPLHRRIDVFWLGGAVTGEREADQMPDSDGVSNILGLTAVITTASDIANLDKADDGWLNRASMTFDDCQVSQMVVRVSRGVVPLPANAIVRLNAWFDGNRDGDWADRGQCPGNPGLPPGQSFEWIVQNEMIPVGTIPPGGSQVFTIPTVLVYNPNPTPTHWVRLSLGGMATVTQNTAGGLLVTDLEPFPTAPFLPDGRGPVGAYRAGETEDFFIEIVPPNDPPVEGKPDLGDAPDSVQNHWPLTPNNTAYFGPLTLGRYPTVWNSTAPGTDPSGPRHLNAPFHGWLGTGITAEREADAFADVDPTNNIKNGGSDSSNRDLKDDGWLNPGVVFPNCGTTTLRVRVSRDVASAMPRMYLNTWFDGNRDGDWQDTDLECPQGPIAGQNRRWEWIVQNHIVNMGAIPPGGFVDLNVPTRRILNNFPNIEHWVRFSLTEEPLTISNTTVATTLVPALPFRADGRGKQFPLQWRAGETEDYIVETNQHQDPGVLRIDKSLINPYGVNVGNQVITYVIEIDHIGGFGTATTVMTDPLPAAVSPAGPPIVSNPVPSAGPLAATLAGNLLTWNGWLNPGSRIRIEQPVKVKPCIGFGFKVVRNTAYAQQTATAGGGIISDTVAFEQKCKGIIWPGDPVGVGGGITWVLKVNPNVAAPGDEVVGELTMLNKTTETVKLQMHWDLAKAKKVLAREEVDVDPVCPVTPELNGLPPGEVTFTKTLRINPDLGDDGIDDDGTVLVRVSMALEEEPNRCVVTVAPVKIVQTDLGDAPDSSNHPGATMLAYAGVTATYPSVFDPATGAPSGPIHHKPQHFHLGPRVSVERDADLLPDADPTTNLRPVLDLKNLDRWDDGVNLALVKFKDCEVTKLPVRVFIDPVAKFWMTSTQKMGYINVWVDSNRDGDWNDRYDCPQTAGTPPSLATDHIVINHAVNPATLALGLTTISVPTSKVKWFNDNPAWLRVTLTTKPITTPFTFGSINYSDGRGEPYRLGETEDYVWRDVQTNPGDVSIDKKGKVLGIQLTASNIGSSGLDGVEVDIAHIAWSIEMANSGDEPAAVQMRDELPEGWNVARIRVIGQDMDPDAGIFSVAGEPRRKGWDGTIKGNARVAVLIEMTRTVPIDWPTQWPNRVLTVTNTAVLTVTSGSDSNPDNNSSTVTVVVSPQHPPVITGPGDGTVCDGTVALTGLASPGANVDVYLNAVLAGSTVALGNGQWSYTLTGLSNGSHSIYAKEGALTSTAIVVIVNTALAYSPLSMRFTDSAGNTTRPRDGNGRTDDGGWILLLHPFDTYTFSVKLCCTDPNATIDLIINGVTTALSDPDNDMIYSGVFTTGMRGPMSMTIRCLCYGIITDSDGLVLIDPFGEVSDATTSALLAGATVTAMELQGNTYGQWNAGAYAQINPQLTVADGWYSFFTPPGTYQIAVTRAGYQNYRSSDIVVTNALVRHDVALTPVVSGPIKHRVQLTGDGPEPALLKIKPGDAVEFVALAAQNNNTVRSNRGGALARGNAMNPDFDSGTLLPGESFVVKFNEKGAVSYNDGANPGTIIVEGGRPVFLPAVTR